MAAFTKLTEIPPGPYRPLSLLELAPEELTRIHGLNFREDRDDLDAYVWAAIIFEGDPYVFTRHARSPEAGTVLHGRALSLPLVRALDLEETWISSEQGKGFHPADWPDCE